MTISSEEIDMLKWFWSERGDPFRWTGYEGWKTKNPAEAAELERLINDMSWATRRVSLFFDELLSAAYEQEEQKP